MSEEATEAVAQPSRAEQVEAAWEHAKAETAAEAPAKPEVTAEALDEKPAREAVAPSIREFLRAQKPAEPSATSALEQEISELRGALDSIASHGQEKEELSKEDIMLEKLSALEERERLASEADVAAKQEEEFNQRVAALRAGAIENINARKEDYPGLVALEQQDTVVNALFQRLEEGQETSEDEVSSEVEGGLREVYEKLHAVYGATQSKEAPKPTSERQTTLTPALAGTDDEPDFSNMSRKEKIDFLWNKNQ